MSSGEDRVDPFASLAQFKPKSADVAAVSNPADIEKISQDNGFPSREAKPAQTTPGKRARYNSGEPRVQLNIKVTQESHSRFYDMAAERNLRLGDLLSKALDALVAIENDQSRG